MANESYSIVFDGELAPGVRREETLKHIAHLTNLERDDLLDRLFSVKPLIIQQTDDAEIAARYLQAFTEAGLVIRQENSCAEHDEMFNADISFGHYAPRQRVEAAPNYVVDTAVIDAAYTDTANTDQQTESAQRHNDPNEVSEADSPSEEDCYGLVFEGELAKGVNKAQVIDNLVQLTKSNTTAVTEAIFSVVPVLILSSHSRAEIDDYHEAFSAAGLVLHVNNHQQWEETLARSPLRLRGDAPVPPAEIKIRPFTYALMGLAVLSMGVWATVYFSYQSLFKTEQPLTLDVALVIPATPPSVPLEAEQPEAIPEPAELIQKPAPGPTPTEMDEPPLQASPPIPPLPAEPVAKKTPVVETTKTEHPATQSNTAKTEEERNINNEYYLELLNWFADPAHQQGSGQQLSNLEGDVTLKITITRTGELTNAEVVASSSQQLAEVTRQMAQDASPYPSVPEEIRGETYSFTLPLQYQLER